MNRFWQDIRYGVRSLWKRPGFTVVALITLALGIGANTAIFSVVNAVVLRPLPYAEPDRLMTLWETMPGSDHRSVAPGNFVDWRTQNRTFQDMAAAFYANFNLTSDGEPDRIDGATITSNYMSVLGAGPQLGRTFQADDDDHQDRSVVLISDGLWKRRFGADQKVVGRTITIDEVPHTIVGVMSRGFQFPERSDLWVLGRNRGAVPTSLISQVPTNDWVHERDAHFIRVIGRLRPGVTLSQAQSDIAAITRKAELDFPKTNGGLGSNVVPLHAQVVGDVRRGALHSAWSSRFCFAHRLHQRGKPDACARHATRPRDRDPHRSWRQPLPLDQAIANREFAAQHCWRVGGPGRLRLGRRLIHQT